MDEELKQALEGMEARLLDRIEATETRLLKAYMGWGQSVDLKLKTVPLIEARMNVAEERITELERKNLQRGL
jgi:hypothetical protein